MHRTSWAAKDPGSLLFSVVLVQKRNVIMNLERTDFRLLLEKCFVFFVPFWSATGYTSDSLPSINHEIISSPFLMFERIWTSLLRFAVRIKLARVIFALTCIVIALMWLRSLTYLQPFPCHSHSNRVIVVVLSITASCHANVFDLCLELAGLYGTR